MPSFFFIAQLLALVFFLINLVDYGLLFLTNGQFEVQRQMEDLFSHSDENQVEIIIRSSFGMKLYIAVIDELPFQFQQRDFEMKLPLGPKASTTLAYNLRPTTRGEYQFGQIHLYVATGLFLVQRRFTSELSRTIKVYPSFLQLRKYSIQSIPDSNASVGLRRSYRKGMSTEFDHIKEYNRGDDARTINWKASARRDQLMINSYMDEKSQQIYCVIDKGRLMKMPFNELSLIDYAINASLMFSYVALQKDDKIGLITFAEKVDEILPPSKSKSQFNHILEMLYKQDTKFQESNFADLYKVLSKRAGQRSLLMLFTNFETFSGFERQLPYLRIMNRKHVLCVVLFENIELNRVLEERGDNIEDIYVKTIANKFIHEKRLIVKELKKHGIWVIYTSPADLTINTVNKYLDLKAKQII